MRSIKMVLVAAVAAMALMAVAGAGSAFGAADALCNVQTSGQGTCPTGNQYPANTSFTGKSTNSQLVSGSDTIKCTNSDVTVKNSVQTGDPITGQVTGLTFNGTCLADNLFSCVITVQNLPYSGTIAWISGTWNGTLTVNSPSVNVNCSGVLNCTFTATSISGTLTGGNPATVQFTNQTLTSSACSRTGSFSATYTLNGTNTSVFVEPA